MLKKIIKILDKYNLDYQKSKSTKSIYLFYKNEAEDQNLTLKISDHFQDSIFSINSPDFKIKTQNPEKWILENEQEILDIFKIKYIPVKKQKRTLIKLEKSNLFLANQSLNLFKSFGDLKKIAELETRIKELETRIKELERN